MERTGLGAKRSGQPPIVRTAASPTFGLEGISVRMGVEGRGKAGVMDMGKGMG
jgi:hypothetical protein